jgi:hypothetical protein
MPVAINTDSIVVHISDRDARDDLLANAGFDYMNPDVVSHFDFKTELDQSFELKTFLFDTPTDSSSIIRHLDREGYKAAEFMHLVKFAILFPDFQRTVPVIALGSIWQRTGKDGMVPALWGGESSRELNICSFGTRWFGGDAFLGVRSIA